MRKLIALILILFSAFAPVVFRASADELDEVTEELADQAEKLSELEKKKDQLANDIASASVSFYQISNELSQAEEELTKIQEELVKRGDILEQWEENRNLLIRDLYKMSRFSPIEVFFSSDNLGDSTKQLQYYDENLELLEDQITLLVGEITTFEKNKAKAQELRDELADLKSQVSSGLAYSQSQLSSTSGLLAQVKSSIKNLTAKQEQLILAKFAASEGSETVGENPPPSEDIPNPTFSQRPAFMIGAYGYTHRIGMSQWGAYGRAIKGQSYTTILKAYYGSNVSVGSYPVPNKIKVDSSAIPFEDKYLFGIAEMPSSWDMDALKAQAIAARTYALYRTSWKNYIGKESSYLTNETICATTFCQVYSSSKAQNPPQRWRNAVEQTEGIVAKLGGVPMPAFYHSTAGGYTISKWQWINYWTYNDGIKDFCTSSSCGADKGKAYEEIANAPWYHTGWGSRYKKTAPQYASNKYQPWMTEEEFADIFNALRLCTTNGQTMADCDYISKLSPIDQQGWDMSTVRSKLSNPITSITNTFVSFTSNKVNTKNVYVHGPAGTFFFSAKDFLAMFNLRARGTLMIPWTYRFDIGTCTDSSCTNPTFK